VQGWRAAEVRERQLRAVEGSLAPAEALEAALELCELMPENADSDPLVNEKPSGPAWLGGVFGMAGGKRKAPLRGSLRAAIAAVGGHYPRCRSLG